MFSFKMRPEKWPAPPNPLVRSKRPLASELFGSIEAQAVLVSEPDDRDWLVAFKNDPDSN
jgi:hypothetical protein